MITVPTLPGLLVLEERIAIKAVSSWPHKSEQHLHGITTKMLF